MTTSDRAARNARIAAYVNDQLGGILDGVGSDIAALLDEANTSFDHLYGGRHEGDKGLVRLHDFALEVAGNWADSYRGLRRKFEDLIADESENTPFTGVPDLSGGETGHEYYLAFPGTDVKKHPASRLFVTDDEAHARRLLAAFIRFSKPTEEPPVVYRRTVTAGEWEPFNLDEATA